MTLPLEITKNLLPHRYPFLFIDRILEKTKDSCTSLKNLSINEEFFKGHFPDNPILPGIYVIEIAAQTAAHMGNRKENEIFMLVGVDDFKFNSQAIPGDQIICKVTIEKKKFHLYYIKCDIKIRKPDGTEKPSASGFLKCASIKKK